MNQVVVLSSSVLSGLSNPVLPSKFSSMAFSNFGTNLELSTCKSMVSITNHVPSLLNIGMSFYVDAQYAFNYSQIDCSEKSLGSILLFTGGSLMKFTYMPLLFCSSVRPQNYHFWDCRICAKELWRGQWAGMTREKEMKLIPILSEAVISEGGMISAPCTPHSTPPPERYSSM